MTPAEIMTRELESLKADLVKRYDELGLRASGNFEEELEVVITERDSGINGKLLGPAYTIQLMEGRAPGKFPPIDQIEDWVNQKGIASRVAGEISISSLVYLIARKIAREGTEIFKQGGTDLIESVVTPERLQSMVDKIGQLNVSGFVDSILDQIRGLKQAA